MGTSGGVEATTSDRPPELDKAIQFLYYLMLEKLGDVIHSNYRYSFCDKWPVSDICRSRRCLLSIESITLPESATKALNIFRPRLTQVEVTKSDKNGNVLMRTCSQLLLSASCKNHLLLFLAAGWTGPKLGIKRSSSDKKCTLYMQTIQNKR